MSFMKFFEQLYLSGVPGFAPLRRVLHAVALPARVTLNPLTIDFKSRVVFKREMINGSYTLQLTLNNEEDKIVQW